MTIILEPLDARYEASHPPLSPVWLNDAIQDVLKKLDEMLPRFSHTFPAASASSGHYPTVEKVDWTEGFWTGMLWLAWEVTGDDKYRQVAKGLLDSFETRLDNHIKVDTHDLGFLYLLSCVNAWRLTGNERARSLALRAAELLKQLPITDPLRPAYHHAITQIAQNLRQHYFAHHSDGLLREGVYNFGRNMGINEPNLWGDYFWFEALVRLTRIWTPYW
ncbi:glycoside hydrolase family 88 protein [Pectobacterium aroidearum]|uniref:glycoside hydrolase family 88 protein n=1 Tax=Pectobacterium aroidearum TaxID=1201031 RepID=UPI0032EE0C22